MHKAIVEADGSGGLLVLLPDGEVVAARSGTHAARLMDKWQREKTPPTGVTVMAREWRGDARHCIPEEV